MESNQAPRVRFPGQDRVDDPVARAESLEEPSRQMGKRVQGQVTPRREPTGQPCLAGQQGWQGGTR